VIDELDKLITDEYMAARACWQHASRLPLHRVVPALLGGMLSHVVVHNCAVPTAHTQLMVLQTGYAASATAALAQQTTADAPA
jgi:hypothetical protein